MPSAKYSCAGSPERLASGSTASDSIGQGEALPSSRSRHLPSFNENNSASTKTMATPVIGIARRNRAFTAAGAIAVLTLGIPMNRYPRRGTVSTNLGFSAESPRVSRRRLIAVLRPVSKSTNVSAGQSVDRSSSRVTTAPACSRSFSNTW
jgi:hypothetical protein